MYRRRGYRPTAVLAVFVAVFALVVVLGRCGPRVAQDGDPAPTADVSRNAARAVAGGHAAARPTTSPSSGDATSVPLVTVTREPRPARAASQTLETQATRAPRHELTPTPKPRAKRPHPHPTRTPTPAPRYYTVVQGDTLWGISQRFGTTVQALTRANGISASEPLRIGQKLRIPRTESRNEERGGGPTGLRLPPVSNSVPGPVVRPLRALAPDLVSYLGFRRGESAVAVYVPATNTMYSWNSNVRFYTASTVKVPIMVTLLSERYEADPGATSPGSGLLSPMITASDNDAATALFEQVGGASAVQAELERRGITHTHVDPSHWGLTTTTAPDMALLMRSLYYGQRLNPALRAAAFDLMSHVISGQRWGVPAGLPRSAYVAFKGGWLPVGDGWVVHQVGVVSDGGRTYIFAFYNKGQPSFAYGQETLRRSGEILYARMMSR